MSERMSDERLAEIRKDHTAYEASHAHAGSFACCSAHSSADDVPELLAEVERLRTALGEFGNVRLAWGVQHPLLGTEGMDGPINASAACLQRNALSVRQKWAVVTRLVGEWREAD